MPSNLGATALSNTVIGLDPKKTSRALTVIKPQRQLPQRDYQGKFVERNTGLMLNALSNIYSQLRQLVDLTKQSLNIEKKEQLDEKAEKRDERIAAGETDIPPKITETKKGPGILGKMKGALGSVWAGMGTKTAFALVVGGLALLSKFSDDLVGPLTKVLEWIRDRGSPGIKALAIEMTEKVKEKWDKFMEGWKRFFTYWFTKEGAGYLFVTKVFDFFAVDKHEKEDGKMLTDFEKKIEEWKTTLTNWRAYLGVLPGMLFMGLFFKRAFPMGVPLKGGRGLPGGRISKFIKGGTALGLVGLILYGLYALRESVEDGSETFKEELIKDGKAAGGFNWSALRKGIVDAVTVDDDSGFTGAFRNVLPMGGTAVGLVATLGLPLLLVPGAYPAAVFAAAMIGGTVGLITGALGEERVDRYLKLLDPTVDGWAKDMFGIDSPLIKSIKWIWSAYELIILRPWNMILDNLGKVTGSDWYKSFLELDLDPTHWIQSFTQGYEPSSKRAPMLSKEERMGPDVNPDKVAAKSDAELFAIQSANLANIKALPILQENPWGNTYATPELNKLRKYKAILKTIDAEIKDRGLHRETSKERDFLKELRDLDKIESLDIRSIKDIYADKDMSGMSDYAKAMVSIGNKVGSDNTNVKTENVYAGGFTVSDNYSTAVLLSKYGLLAKSGGFAY